METYTRGAWNEIKFDSLDSETRQAVRTLVEVTGESAKVDEHGSWDFGVAFDSKARGQALNWNLYGVGHDVHTKRLLAVIQIRQYSKRHKNWYPRIRKNYFLLGTNEDVSTFAHPVSSAVVHAAIRRGKDVILAVQNWIFDGDYSSMWRQGDIALIRVPRPHGDPLPESEIVLEESHRLVGELRNNGNLYVRNPVMEHIPGTHPRIEARGWYRVIVGRRSDFWKFAAPTKD